MVLDMQTLFFIGEKAANLISSHNSPLEKSYVYCWSVDRLMAANYIL